MKNEESKKLRNLRALVRKSLRDGVLTEKEFFAFMRSRRPPTREYHRPTINELRNEKK